MSRRIRNFNLNFYFNFNSPEPEPHRLCLFGTPTSFDNYLLNMLAVGATGGGASSMTVRFRSLLNSQIFQKCMPPSTTRIARVGLMSGLYLNF